MIRIGVLALQGGFSKHIELLSQLGIKSYEIRKAKQLSLIDALILPGGESTTNIKLLLSNQLFEPIQKFAEKKSLFGTCAGSILMGKSASNFNYPTFQLLDVTIERNAYGRQINSFFGEFSFLNQKVSAMFIRAPKFSNFGKDIKILAKYGNEAVIVRNYRHLISTCHPELVNETKIHQYFIDEIVQKS